MAVAEQTKLQNPQRTPALHPLMLGAIDNPLNPYQALWESLWQVVAVMDHGQHPEAFDLGSVCVAFAGPSRWQRWFACLSLSLSLSLCLSGKGLIYVLCSCVICFFFWRYLCLFSPFSSHVQRNGSASFGVICVFLVATSVSLFFEVSMSFLCSLFRVTYPWDPCLSVFVSLGVF